MATSEGKFTKGPWAFRLSDGCVLVFSDGGARELVASVEGQDKRGDLANARLIAAAPDLLAALKDILIDPGVVRARFPVRIMDAARAAIAKTEGRDE